LTSDSWQFQTIPRNIDAGIRYEWCWRRTGVACASTVSRRTFPSLRLCVEDARQNGFSGTVDPTAGMRLTDRSDSGLKVAQAAHDAR
jgi:hypothetical protein